MTTISKFTSRYFKILATVVPTGVCLAFLMTSCQKPAEKVETARDNVADANQNLKEAKREARAQWQEDWLKVKNDNNKEITDNERRIIDLRKDVNGVDERYRAKYNTQIDELETKNNELRDRVNNARDDGDVAWDQFKKDVKHDSGDLKERLKNITIKNG